MKHVRISCSSDDPILRQTSGHSGLWNNVQFHVDSGDRPKFDGTFDHWIVFEGVRFVSKVACAGETIFVPWEPQPIKVYNPKFLSQFDRILTSRPDIIHPNITRSHPLLPWWIGTSGGHGLKTSTLDYDFFSDFRGLQKRAFVSCICSDKQLTDGHRKRLEFVLRLKELLGERLVIFGHGFNECPDKWDAISPFQYHLALENCSATDYWTEKVADAFLGNSFLFYWGCPNLSDFFPTESFSEVDRSDPVAAATTILRFLDTGIDERVFAAVETSKQLVLDRYNLFSESERLVNSARSTVLRTRRIRPENEFDLSLRQRARSFYNRFSGAGVPLKERNI